jgi:hypothetical protein
MKRAMSPGSVGDPSVISSRNASALASSAVVPALARRFEVRGTNPPAGAGWDPVNQVKYHPPLTLIVWPVM